MNDNFDIHCQKFCDSLPTPSGTAMAIMRLVQHEGANTDTLAQLVQSDPALTGRILRFANSPAINGERRPVASVMDAMSLLGVQAVRQFALSLSLVDNHRKGRCEAFDYAAYWSMSLARAVALQAVTAREPTVAPKEAFTLGLLADIGRLALATVWPEEYAECLRRAEGKELIVLERERFSVDHDMLTLLLLQDWGFPPVFLAALKLSHEPETGDDSRTGRFARQLAFARQVARYCLADNAYRIVLWQKLRSDAEKYALDDDTLTLLLSTEETEWREWGKLIGVETDIRQTEPEAIAPDGHAEEGLDVLLVDDDMIMLTRLSKHLAAEGHHVVTRRDGESALEYVFEHKPQLVITDWRMKPMNGLELCKALRASAFGGNLYIIMLTATESEDALVEAFDAGIDDYVTKPPSVRVLKARIRAGQRIITLHKNLARERKEIERYSSELAAANRRLELMAHTDLLTGLPNRRYALDRLEQEWADTLHFNRPISVMAVDLDWFKSINDTLGHDAGDQALAHTATVMRDTVRASDIVCRMGGEEFLVITPNTDCAAALQTADRLRCAIEQQQPAGLALSRPLTVSIGIAGATPATSSWKDLILRADQALYRVKQNGRNGTRLAP